MRAVVPRADLKSLETFDKILAHCGIAPSMEVNIASSNHRTRRQYRGDRVKPAMDPSYAHSWIVSYRNVTTSSPDAVAACEAMVARQEHRVAMFGYSLRDLFFFSPSPLMKRYLIDE